MFPPKVEKETALSADLLQQESFAAEQPCPGA
jgi:hypothetical protein